MHKTIKIKLHVTTERDDIRIVKTLRRGLFTALDSAPYHIAQPDHVVIEDISIEDIDTQADHPLWDYRLIDAHAFDGSSVEIMNNMGDNGWELVSYSDIIHSPKSEGYYFVRMTFKRLR